jgi:LysR family transcriptional activator of nhaA
MFPAPAALKADILEQFNAVPVGELAQVREEYFAISTELKIRHPAVEAILSATHSGVFNVDGG